MKNLRITIATLMSVIFFNVNANADIGVGLAGSFINIEASGNETSDTTGSETDSSVNSASVDNEAFIGSIFAEYRMDNSFTIGYEHTPGQADVSDKFKTRTDTETSVTDDDTTNEDSREFKANAEIENYDIIYAEYNVYNNIYLRAGLAQIDVNTLETASSNGGSYGNASLDGFNYGIGYKNGGFKLSYEATDFDSLSLTSTGNSVAAETNKISADLDTWALKLSYGLYF
jgi:hypothetical protein